MKSLGRSLFVVSVIALLAGCYHNPYLGSPSSWGNYKCVASNFHTPRYVSHGWGATEDRARSNALDKCRARSQYPEACKIKNCHD